MLYPNGVNTAGFISILLSLVAYLMALAVAVSFHEFAHAFAAKCEGDYTAKAYGRYTLAPHAHFDFTGFIFLLLFRFGWAKPVPVDSRNFKRGKKSELFVASAGIITNLLLGIIFIFIYMLLNKFVPKYIEIPVYGLMLELFLSSSISLNFVLAFLNLLPIYPLDGYKIIESFSKTENTFLRVTKQYAFIIFLLLSITGLYYYYFAYTAELLMSAIIKLFSIILGM